jgi:hypothetical protein
MPDIHPLTKAIFVRIIDLADEEKVRDDEELYDMLEDGLAHPTKIDQIEHQLYPGVGRDILNHRGCRVNQFWPADERIRAWRERMREI